MIDAIEGLFDRQIRMWPLLAAGIENLKRLRARTVRMGWYNVSLRHIPHRIASTTAAVDRESIERRPCFLCPGSLPPEEEAIPFNEDFGVYCNPFPILRRHLTIVHQAHRPQLIEGNLAAMLDLARALPDYFIIYNGPQCGASAPDHLHFQACSREFLPIANDTARLPGPAVPDYGRRVVLLRADSRQQLEDRLARCLEALSTVTGVKPEPLINIAMFHDGAAWAAYVFPRGKHRPDVFFTGELTVSPAAIDLCGIVVVPVERDFDQMTAGDVLSIFEEVTLAEDAFTETVRLLEPSR